MSMEIHLEGIESIHLISRSISQSLNLSVSQSDKHLVSQMAIKSFIQTGSHSVSHSLPFGQSVINLVEQPRHQTVSRLRSQSVSQSYTQSVAQFVSQSFSQLINQPVIQSVG